LKIETSAIILATALAGVVVGGINIIQAYAQPFPVQTGPGMSGSGGQEQPSWCDGSMAPMGDPMVNMMLCQTQGVMNSYAVQKDTTWNPPTSPEAFAELCETQATNAGLNPQQYCQGIMGNCMQVQLSAEECYGQYFVEPGVAPQEIMKSNIAKFDAAGRAAEMAGAGLPSGPGQSFGLMGPGS